MQSRAAEESGEVRPSHPPQTGHKAAKIGSQVLLGAIGLGAGALYYGPAQVCASNITCGQWLSDAIGKEPAVILFSAGGVDFASINAFFSSKSVDRYIHYMKKQDNNWQRALKTGLVLAHSASQTVSVILTTETTSSHLAEQIITVGGIIPGVFYGTVGLMEKDIPWLISLAKKGMRRSYWGITSCFFEISPEEQLYRDRMMHYAKEYQRFLARAEHNWRYISSHPESVKMEDVGKKPLPYLLKVEAEEDKHPWLTKGVHHFAQFVGMAVSANHSAAFLVNTHNGFKQRIPNEVLLWLTTLALNSSITYSNTMVTMRGTTGVINNAANLLRGKRTNSLMFNMHPVRAAAVLVSCAVLASISYTVENMLFEEEFPGPDVGARHALRISANAGMIFYHLVGMFHFFHLMTAMMTRNEREHFIFQLEAAAERSKTTTYEDFLQLVDTHSIAENEELGIETFVGDRVLATADPRTLSDEELVPGSSSLLPQAGQIQERNAPQPTDSRSWWCRLFGPSSTAEERQPLIAHDTDQPREHMNSIRSDISDELGDIGRLGQP